jgi:hypothetical protein
LGKQLKKEDKMEVDLQAREGMVLGGEECTYGSYQDKKTHLVCPLISPRYVRKV